MDVIYIQISAMSTTCDGRFLCFIKNYLPKTHRPGLTKCPAGVEAFLARALHEHGTQEHGTRHGRFGSESGYRKPEDEQILINWTKETPETCGQTSRLPGTQRGPWLQNPRPWLILHSVDPCQLYRSRGHSPKQLEPWFRSKHFETHQNRKRTKQEGAVPSEPTAPGPSFSHFQPRVGPLLRARDVADKVQEPEPRVKARRGLNGASDKGRWCKIPLDPGVLKEPGVVYTWNPGWYIPFIQWGGSKNR